MSVSVTIGVMRPLLGKLAELAGGEYSKLKGVKKQASFLEKELSAMNAALEKMELMDELDPVARDWRDHVREMSYDMENCIDDFIRQFGGGHAEVGFIKKTVRRLKTLRERHRIADRMEELKVLALEANERRIRYKIDEYNPNSSLVAIDPRMSAIYVEATGLVGTNGPRKKLVKLLTDDDKKLKVVSVVGFGGLGKTTLVKQVYDEIGGQFDCTTFVPVSQRPNITRFMMRLLHHICIQLKLKMDEFSPICEVQDIIDDLRSYLTHQRYLIVVDDLWDQSTWNTIRRAFPENANGSRVILTTRLEGVACGACYGRPECIYRMKPLDEHDSKKLFFNRVYGSEDDHPSRFEEISTEILKKCGGLPLAIITIASLLASRPERLRDEWESIRNSLGAQFAINPTLEGMKSILNLSYMHLPLHLRACFLHLGMYPEDREIERDDLVRQWLAEGFVSNLHGKDMMVVAKSYFNELVNRSLIQPARTKHGEVFSCRVHDMMLDLILSKCEEHNFVRVECSSEDMVGEHDWKYKVRRISINFSVGGAGDETPSRTLPYNLFGGYKYMPPLSHFSVGGAGDETPSGTLPSNLSQVRSLALFGGYKYMPPLSHFKYLRVILFRISGKQFDKAIDLTCINQLFQLRYLKVSSVQQYIKLPTEMQGLVHLETLDLDCKQWLEIPSDLVHMPRLSHLVVPQRTRLLKGISNMKSLRTLDRFEVGWSSSEDLKGLGELTNLRSLRLSKSGLSFSGEAEAVALASSIGMLHDLRYLRIDGSFLDTSDRLGSLSAPFRDIKVLILGDWRMSRVPKWICGLQYLSWLDLDVDACTDEFHALGELPSLVHLRLWLWSIPEDSAVIFSMGSFPVLKECRCLSLHDVTAFLAFEAGAMPKLRRLRLQFDKNHWGGGAPVGLEHLSSLQRISIEVSYDHRELIDEVLLEAESAFRNCTQRHPSRPSYTVRGRCCFVS